MVFTNVCLDISVEFLSDISSKENAANGAGGTLRFRHPYPSYQYIRR